MPNENKEDIMKQGRLIKNTLGRFALEDGYYWTCGDSIELNIDGHWMKGRIEADINGNYYFTNGREDIYPNEGWMARVQD